MVNEVIELIYNNLLSTIIIIIVVFLGLSVIVFLLISFFKNNRFIKTKDGWKIDGNNFNKTHETCENYIKYKEEISNAKKEGKKEGVMYSDIRHQLLNERNQLIRDLVLSEVEKLIHEFYEKNVIELILEKDSTANPTATDTYMLYQNVIIFILTETINKRIKEYISLCKFSDFIEPNNFLNMSDDAIINLWAFCASFEDKRFGFMREGSTAFSRKELAEKQIIKKYIFENIIRIFLTKLRAIITEYSPKFDKLKQDYAITDDFLETIGSSECNVFR